MDCICARTFYTHPHDQTAACPPLAATLDFVILSPIRPSFRYGSGPRFPEPAAKTGFSFLLARFVGIRLPLPGGHRHGRVASFVSFLATGSGRHGRTDVSARRAIEGQSLPAGRGAAGDTPDALRQPS